ncbi:ABC transporter permease [Hyunsoonleella pacifica]|uniref:ABC transporter permease n=1 Tax=Hyunsoonleella pacifica TaxID=1080224 RepID=A0A4Q9FP17_9FLAO|nr:ABC transporter permease [Hyunsoonleella pacifica]TBN16455.1 ABC transporter permease [Hyunsoonleella pacifica]GGD19260.1 ABC transporter permease [Hyunsoonleella pacifica]
MFDLDLWREIFQSINKNRTRSLLSGFTIAFAILLFTILFGIANGLENTFIELFGTDARNSIVVFPGRTSKAHKGLQSGRRIRFKNEDYDYIIKEFGDDVEFITSKVNRNVEASFKGEKNSYQVRAVHPEHMYIENNIVEKGRYINNSDLENRTKVAVIGEAISEDLFANQEAIGKYINLSGIPYKVVGIFSDDEGDSEENVIYTPITTAQRVYGNNDYIDFIHLTYNPKLSYDQAIAFGNSLTLKLKEKFDVARDDQRAIRVRNFAEGTKGVSQMMFVLNFIVLFVGLGTLIAGIMGISNIMVFIVKERTKELGVRKALGASPRSIVSIILLESILITSLAGYVGLLIGAAVLKIMGPGLKDYFITNPGVDTSVVIGATILLIISGALAGYLPANKASKIKPIVALRNE